MATAIKKHSLARQHIETLDVVGVTPVNSPSSDRLIDHEQLTAENGQTTQVDWLSGLHAR